MVCHSFIGRVRVEFTSAGTLTALPWIDNCPPLDGLTISNSLLWNDHVDNIVKKTNKCLFFIILLKRAQVPLKEIIMFYCTCIRPVLVFNHDLCKYLSEDLERVLKGVFSISRRDIPTKSQYCPINDVTSAKA